MKSVFVVVGDVRYSVGTKFLAKLLVSAPADGEIILSPTDENVLVVTPMEDTSAPVLKEDFLEAFKQVSYVSATAFADNERFMNLLGILAIVNSECNQLNEILTNTESKYEWHRVQLSEFEIASGTGKYNSAKATEIRSSLNSIRKQLNDLESQLNSLSAFVTEELIAFGNIQ